MKAFPSISSDSMTWATWSARDTPGDGSSIHAGFGRYGRRSPSMRMNESAGRVDTVST